MSEFYIEQLVKKSITLKDVIIKGILMGLAIVLLFLSITIMPYLMTIAVVLIVVTVWINKRMDVEFEYLCLNGDIDIDKVMAKSKRKHLSSIKIEELEVLAPCNHQELKKYQSVPTYNYSSFSKDAKLFKAIINQDRKLKAIIFEPKEEMIEAVYLKAPRKVFK